ncbi:hypothetical protein AVEN_230561-1 [Araneus ventricosus]|uniref:Uncharacterized protein n=1 Tax=Araneus ventricosus TaxID=182803 RepID=A0A4Y2GII9_ARAVE|nr:hypothetical protein AVEN_230561-1 [Araneus ventricosus]
MTRGAQKNTMPRAPCTLATPLKKAYIGFRSADSKTTNKRIVQDVPREERKLGPACNSQKCQESKKRGCDTMPEQERQSLFDGFWLTMSWDLKNMFVCSTVDLKSIKRKTVKGYGMRQRKSP